MKSDVVRQVNDEKRACEDELGQKRKLGLARSSNNIKSSIPICWSRRKSVKAGPSTPVHPWRLEPAALHHHHHRHQTLAFLRPQQNPLSASSPTTCSFPPHQNPSSYSSSVVSARKLAAAVYEFQYFAHSMMHRYVNGGTSQGAGAGQGRVRRGQTGAKDKGVEQSEDQFHEQPETASSLKRHIAAALMQHHRSMDMHYHRQQPLSPASNSSSTEITRYNPVVAPSPTSSLEFKAKIGDPNYSLKTSTELLKVLNRIWSLEEQHASSVSLIQTLKMELHNARSKVKELAQDRQADRQEIDELTKQIKEDKLIRISKEHDRANMAIQSLRDELESERQLRKRSESLHRKLAHELMEAKSSFSNVSKELERERTSRVLLEGLCDEFAKGVKDYEHEVHALRQKLPNEETTNEADRLILYVSEAWMDERMQMKHREARSHSMEKYSVVDKLRPKVERFLQARRNSISGLSDQKSNRKFRESRLRRNSMESVPMNDVGSAPPDVGYDDSVESDSHCFELKKPANVKDRSEVVLGGEGQASSSQINQKPSSGDREHTKSRNTSSLQVKFEEQMSRAMSNEGNSSQYKDAEEGRAKHRKPADLSITQKSEICEEVDDGSYSNHGPEANKGSNSNYTVEHLIRNQQLMSEGGSMHLKKDPGETSYRNRASPVRQWMSKATLADPITAESSSRIPPGVKENTLKAKLLEARIKGQRSKFKAPKGTS